MNFSVVMLNFEGVSKIRRKTCGWRRWVIWFDNHGEHLGGGFQYFLFSPLFGEDSHFDDHIFQMGWFNHQLDMVKQICSWRVCGFLVGFPKGFWGQKQQSLGGS